MGKKTAWRAVAEALAAEGVERVFGLPGNPIHLVADLARHTSIQNVLVRHEHSGAACAYATARVTGGPPSATATRALASPTWRPPSWRRPRPRCR